ncbi:MAG: hypothetical protein IPJ65_00535 [Archangiaceae bacterium]|nr:hypothetical protein [Archangiaceae bacterium]
MSSIPVAFEDLSQAPDASGVLVTGWDSSLSTVTLPVPFKYFGVDAGTLVMSPNGWLSTRPGETSTSQTNKTAPGSTAPIGAIAPFYDDLRYNADAGYVLSQGFVGRRGGDHFTVQWHRAALTAAIYAELDFEAKLFDNGVIEFHYGTMNDFGAGLANGSSATIWIEMPDGGGALPISINQPSISPNTAYRFTPKP